MRECDEACPVLARQRTLCPRQRADMIGWAVTREHPATEERVRLGVGCELEVAEQEPRVDPLVESGREVVDVANLDNALEDDSACKSQLHGDDAPEQPIASRDKSKELGVLGSAARQQLSLGIDQGERFDVRHERGQRETAPMRIG